jgi:serine/threonine-protein kinase HipA
MNDSLAVIADDMVAGLLTRLPGGRLEFSYDEAYAARPAATPLSLSMPLAQATHPDSVITPWLWGLLPDDPSVLSRWARHFHLSRPVPFALLGTPIGLDCPGAVRFTQPDRKPTRTPRWRAPVSWPPPSRMPLPMRRRHRMSSPR